MPYSISTLLTQPHPSIGLRKLIHFCLTLTALSLAAPLYSQFPLCDEWRFQ
jgi:hypothetical protein